MILVDAFRGAGMDAFDALVYGAEVQQLDRHHSLAAQTWEVSRPLPDLSGPVQRSRCPTAHFTQEKYIMQGHPFLRTFVVVFLLAGLLLSGSGQGRAVLAQEAGPAAVAPEASALSTAFTYQGQLKVDGLPHRARTHSRSPCGTRRRMGAS